MRNLLSKILPLALLPLLFLGCGVKPPSIPPLPLENDKIVSTQVTLQEVQTLLKQLNGHTDSIGTAIVVAINPEVALAYADATAAKQQMQDNATANTKAQNVLKGQITTLTNSAKLQNDTDVKHFKQGLFGLIFLSILGLVAGLVLENSKYVPSTIDKLLIRGGISMLGVVCGVLVVTLVVGQLIPWLIYAGIAIICVGTIILIIAMIKFAIESKWNIGTITQSVDAGLATIPPEAAAAMKQAMGNVQGASVSAVVTAAKVSNAAVTSQATAVAVPTGS